MCTELLTLIRQDQRPDHIGSHGFQLVRLAPIDVGSACFSSAVEDVGGFDVLEGLVDFGLVLHPDGGGEDGFALLLEEGLQVPGHPASLAPDEEADGIDVVIHFAWRI